MAKTSDHKSTSSSLQRSTPDTTPFIDKEERNGFFSEKNDHSLTESSKELSPLGGSQGGDFFTTPPIQTKLTIGQPNDPYEREADAVADKVVNGQSLENTTLSTYQVPSTVHRPPSTVPTGPGIHKKEQGPEEEETIQEKEEFVQRKPIFESNDDGPDETIQRKGNVSENTPFIQRSPDNDSGESTASSALESRLSASKGAGRPLSEDTRTSMEQSFGRDLSDVRIHTNSSAVQMNKELNAQAFTHGSDIYFNAGRFDDRSREGKRLLAHELVHVGQQGGIRTNRLQRKEGIRPEIDDINDIPIPYNSVLFIKAETPDKVFYYIKYYSDEDVTMISESEFTNSIINYSSTKKEYKGRGNNFQYFAFSLPGQKLPETVIRPEYPKRYKRLVKIVNYFWVPNKEVVALMRGFDLDEQQLFIEDEDTQGKVFKALNVGELAYAITFFSCSYEKKIEWLQKISGFSRRNLRYYEVRELLQLASDESREIDSLLSEVYDPSRRINPSTLGNMERVRELVSNLKRMGPGLYPSVASEFDPYTQDTKISSRDLLNIKDINKSNSLYGAYLSYNQAVEGKLDSSEIESRKSVLDTEIEKSEFTSLQEYEYEITQKEEDLVDSPHLDVFRTAALKVAFRLLDVSEIGLQLEINQILGAEEDRIIDVLKEEQDYYEREMDRLENQRENTISSIKNHRYWDKQTIADNEFFRGKGELLKELRGRLGAKHPVLLDKKIDLEDLYDDYIYGDKSNLDLRDYLLELISIKQKNIFDTKQNLRYDSELIWKLENVIQLTKQELFLPEGSFLSQLVDKKYKAVRNFDENVQIALALCAIGIAIISLGTGYLASAGIITAGTATTAATYLTFASLATSSAILYHTSVLKNQFNPAGDISIGGSDNQLTAKEISKLQIALSYVGVLADLASIALIFKIKVPQVSTSLAKTEKFVDASADVKLLADSPVGEMASYLYKTGKIPSEVDFLTTIAKYRQQLNQQIRFIRENVKQNIDADIFIASLARINNELSIETKLDDLFLERFLIIVAEEELRGTSILAIGAIGAEQSARIDRILKLIPMSRSQLLSRFKITRSSSFLINIDHILASPSPQVKEFITILVSGSANNFIKYYPYLNSLGHIAYNSILPEVQFGTIIAKIQRGQLSVNDVQWIAYHMPKLSPEAQAVINIRLDSTGRHFSRYLDKIYHRAGLDPKIRNIDEASLKNIEEAIISDGATMELSSLVGYQKLTTLREKNIYIYYTTESKIASLINQYDSAVLAGHPPPITPISSAKLEKLSDLMKTEEVSSTYLAESRANLVSKVNKILKEPISSFDEFKYLITNVSQPGSRGTIAESLAKQLNIPPGVDSGIRLNLDFGDWGVISDSYIPTSKSLFECKNGSKSFRDTQLGDYRIIQDFGLTLEPKLKAAGILKEGDNPTDVIKKIIYFVSPGPNDFARANKLKNTSNFIDPVDKASSKFYRNQVSLTREHLEIYTLNTKGEIFLINKTGTKKVAEIK